LQYTPWAAVHTLTLEEPVNLGKTIGVLEKGTWLMHDINAFEIAQRAPRGTATIKNYTHLAGIFTKDHVDKTLIMRSGAIGDLLLLAPALKEWKSRTGGHLSLCCFKHHFPLFHWCDFIDELVAYPMDSRRAGEFEDIISLENTMELNHSKHATDVFADALSVKVTDYRPTYVVKEEEKVETKKHLFTNRPNLGVQMRASVRNRDYPLPLWLKVITKLEQQGWGILLFGQKGQVPQLPPEARTPYIRDLSQMDLSLCESAAVLSQCQAFVGVDSAFLHFCHALDIPAVGLFAAFDWKTRTMHAPKTTALTGVGECAPCSWHMHAGQMFPPGKPCSARQECVVIADISPDRIVQKVSLLKP
jgi:ADP-heptose:LPS heptosyltransferase